MLTPSEQPAEMPRLPGGGISSDARLAPNGRESSGDPLERPSDDVPRRDDPDACQRERSTRYPGVPLAESVELCKFIEARGLDGLTAADVATALGYKNIKTNTFSARLSAARQFGLLVLKDEGYSLTPLARSILHPVDPAEVPRLFRQALLEPPLYADLAAQFADKKPARGHHSRQRPLP